MNMHSIKRMSHPSSSLAAIKAATQSRARTLDSQQSLERDALVLILSHLQSRGFLESATCLLKESMSLKLYEQADNLDLIKVLKEYEEFHAMKYGQRPTFSRLATNENSVGSVNDAISGQSQYSIRNKRKSKPAKSNGNRNELPPLNSSSMPDLKPSRKRSHREGLIEDDKNNTYAQLLEGVTGSAIDSPSRAKQFHSEDHINRRGSLKPLPYFGGDSELRSLALSIQQDIIQTSPRVSWDDIIDLNGT